MNGFRPSGALPPPSRAAEANARSGTGWALLGHGVWIYVPPELVEAAIEHERQLAQRGHLPIRDPTFEGAVRSIGSSMLRGWALFHEQTRARQPLHPLTVLELDALFDPLTGSYTKQPTRNRNGRWSGKFRTVVNKNDPAAPGSANGVQSHPETSKATRRTNV